MPFDISTAKPVNASPRKGGFDISTARPEKESISPSYSDDKWIKNISQYGQIGPMARGVRAVDQGVTAQDIPGIVSQAASGWYGDFPRRAAERPMKLAMAGPLGPSFRGSAPERIQLPFPRPVTEAGKQLGTELEGLAGGARLLEFGSSLRNIGRGTKDFAKSMAKYIKEQKKAKEFSDRLIQASETARKNVGGRYQEYIDLFGKEKVDPETFNRILKNLPPKLAQELKESPELAREVINRVEKSQFVMGPVSRQVSPQITKVKGTSIPKQIEPTFDPSKGQYAKEVITPKKFIEAPEDIVTLSKPGQGVAPRSLTSASPRETYSLRPPTKGVSQLTEGEEIISPSLANAKAIRDIARGKLPSKYWNPKLADDQAAKEAEVAYENIGNLMRSGRGDLGDIMRNYAEVRQAQRELIPALRTAKGFTKTKQVGRLFSPTSEGSKQQALEVLSKYNPEITKISEEVAKYGKGLERARVLSALAKKAAGYAGLGALGYGLLDNLK